jgi:transcriptional regulator with XRE-family HTH domain
MDEHPLIRFAEGPAGRRARLVGTGKDVQHGLTQAQLAPIMGVTPGRISQIERGELSTIEAIARYVQALGGRLDLVASFADHTLTVTTTEAA